MKKHLLRTLVGLCIVTPSLFSQAKPTADKPSVAATQPPIPEEARKHFVMGTTLFKDAKTPDDYAQVESQFKQATDVAPQWPEARYNLALAKEAACDYSGAMGDLKLYQQFKLNDTEARTVQDKLYALEAKAGAADKTRADKQKSADTERDEQQIVALQRHFQELMLKLEGETFVGISWGVNSEITFLRKPFDVGDDARNTTFTTYKSTPYLWAQLTQDNHHMRPNVVIPTSAFTYNETSAFAPTDLSDLNKDTWTLSQDGRTLTNAYTDSEGKYHRDYFTKKQ